MDDRDAPHDAALEALFAREHTHIPAEPFVRATARAVAAARRRALVSRRALRAAGFVTLAALSPWLIAASAWLSGAVGRVSDWLATPVAIAAVLVAAAAFFVGRRWRVW